MQSRIGTFVERAITFGACPDYDGTRLNEQACSSKVAMSSIAEACDMQITDLAEWIRALDEPTAGLHLADYVGA